MHSLLQVTLLTLTLLFTLTLATPLPLPLTTPNEPHNPLTPRTPVSAVAFNDWPTNVVMQGGSQTYGAYIPPDKRWYNMANIDCLDLPAYAIGDCNAMTVDFIGVATGNGPCSFVGSNGWRATLTATSGSQGNGWVYVGPPQSIIIAACG